MQQIFDEVSKRLMSKNPDSDAYLDLLEELVLVETEVPKKRWKSTLRMIAKVRGLEAPECLK